MLAWLQKDTERTQIESDNDDEIYVVKISRISQYLLFTADIRNVILNDLLIPADTHANMWIRGVLALVFFHFKHWFQGLPSKCKEKLVRQGEVSKQDILKTESLNSCVFRCFLKVSTVPESGRHNLETVSFSFKGSVHQKYWKKTTYFHT